MRHKVPLVDSILVESYSAAVDILKRRGYDGKSNVSDYYFAHRDEIDPIIYGSNVHSDEFANMVRWHSSIGIACKKAIVEYFENKMRNHTERLARDLFPTVSAVIDDPDWDKKIRFDPEDLFVTIDFSDFSFEYDNRSHTIKDFTYSFPLGRIGTEIDLIGIDLSGIRLQNCRLVNICFHHANFTNASLFQVELIHTTFSDVIFENAMLATIRTKEHSNFNGADLSTACVFGIFPLGDGCLTEPFYYKEIPYLRLAFLTIKRFLRLGSKQMVSQQPGPYTAFANNPTNELTLPSTKSLKEYILWYQQTFQRIDRLPSTSLWTGLPFVLSVITTKHWTSYLTLVVSALGLNILFAGLYAGLPAHFQSGGANLFDTFYQSVLVFTSFGLEKLSPLTDLGRLIILLEVLFGYVTLAIFVYLMAKKIDRT